MENPEITYCRFCAEPKSYNKLLNLDKNEDIFTDILMKLSFLNAIYVDVKTSSILPKTVCLICYEALNEAYEFLYKVKKSQDLLLSLFDNNKGNKYLELEVNITSDQNSPYETMGEVLETNAEPPVVDDKVFKIEFKEETEANEPNAPSEDEFRDDNDFDSNINVQDIFNEAIQSNPFSPNVTLCVKDMSDINKKTVKSWKDYPWVCAYCNIEFLDIGTLREHSKVVHGKCAPLVCVDCKKYDGLIFESFHVFVNHVKKHRKSLKFHCYYCDEYVDKSEPRSLNFHIKSHIRRSQVACPHCAEILDSQDTLRKHLQEFQAIKPKRKPRRKRGAPLTIDDLTCKLCNKVYKNPNSLRDHNKLHNIDRKRDYTCDRCGKTFFNKGTLTSHIMAHDQIRPHVCKICDKSFLFPNMLRRHVLMHSNIKPFSCEQCGRCFRLQYQLNAHKIIHTDDMPYVCQYCSKAFRFKQILKNHERQHTGAKPYSCEHCGMEFTNWSNYNKHMKRRHNTDTSKKKITPQGVFPINPQTGQIVQVEDPVGTEEWKSKIMIPGKRGKKKSIKQENDV